MEYEIVDGIYDLCIMAIGRSTSNKYLISRMNNQNEPRITFPVVHWLLLLLS